MIEEKDLTDQTEISHTYTLKEVGKKVFKFIKIVIIKLCNYCKPLNENHIDLMYEVFVELNSVMRGSFFKLFTYNEFNILDNEKKRCIKPDIRNYLFQTYLDHVIEDGNF